MLAADKALTEMRFIFKAEDIDHMLLQAQHYLFYQVMDSEAMISIDGCQYTGETVVSCIFSMADL